MNSKHITPFKISGVDSLGQGVSKITNKVTFIAKTTIGDEGEAEIMSEKKGVAFARLKKLDQISELRVEPECKHFATCPSCHFLHVDYGQELRFKRENFAKLFRKLPLQKFEVIEAPRRFGYRNRIQLHYSLKSKLIGMRDPQTFTIHPIPNCLIGLPEVLKEVQRLYENHQWINEVPPSPVEGHVEIYWNNNKLQTSWNKPYAEGGFSQIYEEMNKKLKDTLIEEFKKNTISGLLDLFGGAGNLSSGLHYKNRLCVDIYQNLKGEDFLNLNIYEENSLGRVIKEIKNREFNLTHLILDPPRSGLKDLSLWLEKLRPKYVAYVSCDPHTMARDLEKLEGYSIQKSLLFDFFPSTFHFESLIFLERIE
jgi:23S rRNA (uracil1939-C5)-methyltransferase